LSGHSNRITAAEQLTSFAVPTILGYSDDSLGNIVIGRH
jgi:hypothetical protein